MRSRRASKVPFGHGGNFLAEDVDGSAGRFEQAGGELERESFAGAGFAEQHQSFALRNGEGDAAQNIAFVKSHVDVVEGHHRAIGGGGGES